ncbi:hypothetical protein UT300009_30250 [Paraclostridium bifermentans]
MKVLLANTYSCCHNDEFIGVFSTEDKAKKYIIDNAIREHGKQRDYELDLKFWLELDEQYKEYVLCESFIHTKTEKLVKYRGTTYYRIEDLAVDELC